MTDSRDLFQQITNSLADIESEKTYVREKLRILDEKSEKLKTAQAVLLELQGDKSTKRRDHSKSAGEKKKQGPSRAFRSEGQTAALIRYVYGKGGGCTVIEASKRTGVSMRRTRTAFDRLRESGYMVRSGEEFTLTRKGIEAWQNSPLFGKAAASA